MNRDVENYERAVKESATPYGEKMSFTTKIISDDLFNFALLNQTITVWNDWMYLTVRMFL